MPVGVGIHLLLDGVAARPPDNDMMLGCIDRVVEIIDLEIIHGPLFFALESYREVWVIVAESHICIKVFASGTVLMDVFSCKPFDVLQVREVIATALGLDNYEWKELKRAGTGSE